MTLRFRAAAATDVGKVRDHNEDGYLVDDTLGLVAVADGMGGHNAGEVASAAALEALRVAFGAGATIAEAVSAANEIVYEQSVADRSLRGMGTTLTAGALGIDGKLLLGHVGDSRAYLVRDGSLERITTDHSLVEELIQSGALTEEEAERDPRRSQITRALGLEPGVDIDMESVDLRAGDRLLLCSDGLTTMVSEDEIASFMSDERDPHTAARKMVEAANEAGGADNITVVVIDIEDSENEDTPPPQGSETDDSTEAGDGTVADVPAATDESSDDEAKSRRGLGRLFGRGK
ncbi:MAG TPA: Stp1/IreP family PP2C-type Ser/Thr phosphatase [Acidimicrobiia bacterium]